MGRRQSDDVANAQATHRSGLRLVVEDPSGGHAGVVFVLSE